MLVLEEGAADGILELGDKIRVVDGVELKNRDSSLAYWRKKLGDEVDFIGKG